MSDIQFPIKSNIVVHGKVYVKTLTRGDVVPCYYCGNNIVVDVGTVVIPRPSDAYHKAIRCPECGSVVSTLYYYDKKLRRAK